MPSEAPHNTQGMKRLIFLFSALLCIFSGCSNVIEPENIAVSNKVKFELQPQTRATDVLFEEGDEIGIFVIEKNKSLLSEGNFQDNKRFIIRDGKPVPYTKEDEIYISEDKEYKYYAYSPYNEHINPLNYLLPVYDQSESKIYKSIDFKTSETSFQRGCSIMLDFKHILSLIEVQVEKKKESPFIISQMFMLNVIKNASYSFSTGAVNLLPDKKIFNMEMCLIAENDNFYTYRVLLPPQTLSKDCYFRLIYTNKNTSSDYKINNSVVTKSGEKTSFNFTASYKVVPYSMGHGRVTISKNYYYHGETATVQAIPDEDYTIDCWFAAPDFLNIVSKDATFSFPVYQYYNLGARFKMKTEEFIIIETTDDGGNGGTTEGAYEAVTRYQDWGCVANPNFDNGYNFEGWYDVNGNFLTYNRNYDFTMPNHTFILEARFKRTRYEIFLTITGNQNGNAVILNPGGGWVGGKNCWWEKNTNCTMETRHNPNTVKFLGWYENGVKRSTEKQYTFTVMSNRHIEARFQ